MQFRTRSSDGPRLRKPNADAFRVTSPRASHGMREGRQNAPDPCASPASVLEHDAGGSQRGGQPPRRAPLIALNARLHLRELPLLLPRLPHIFDRAAEPFIGRADRLHRGCAGESGEQLADLRRNILADTDYAEAMTMREFEMRVARAKLVPQKMHAEAVAPFGGIVKQNDAAA